MPIPMKHNLQFVLVSIVAGAIYPFGFAPFAWWPLTLVSVAIMFSLWAKLNRRDALWSALIYGLVVYGVGVSWVYVSMVNFGGMAPFMAVIAVVLFALLLSTFLLVLVMVYKWIEADFTALYQQIFLLPVLWVVFEGLRGSVLTGFSWLQLGYALVDTWYSGWATIAGVLMVSFIGATIAGMLAYSVRVNETRAYFLVGTILGVLTLGSWSISSVRWTEPVGQPIDVTLVQADIPLAQKWLPEHREDIMQTYLAASKAVQETDLIIWPEGALPMVLDEIPEQYLSELRALSGQLMFGVIETEKVKQQTRAFNGLALLTEEQIQVYRKRHLVPFGEYFPLKPLLGWLFNALEIPMSNFTRGDSTQPSMKVNGLLLLPTICYEDAFPEDWRQQVSEANILLNISEDAWFGDSFAPHQRLQMARMRTIEFQRPLIRVSNTGLSTVIDAFGESDAISPQFQPALFNTPVFGMQGETPYTQYGQWPLWLCLLISLGFCWLRGRAIET